MPRPLIQGILGVSTIILSKILINMLLCVVRFFMKQTLLQAAMGHPVVSVTKNVINKT